MYSDFSEAMFSRATLLVTKAMAVLLWVAESSGEAFGPVASGMIALAICVRDWEIRS
ncbi:MAG: hypothetical protein IKR81_11170 [Victivallales bacterium]|nr:hypothetical protein [Victivallales bacterium]